MGADQYNSQNVGASARQTAGVLASGLAIIGADALQEMR